MENACAVVMRNENMSLTHFHLQVNCILQERAEMLVDWLRFIIKFSRFSSYYSKERRRRDGKGHVYLTVSWGHIHLRKFAHIVIIKFIWRQFSCFELRCSSSLYCSFKDIFWKGTSAKINRSKGNRSFVSDSTWLYNRHCPSSECPH